MYASTTRDDVNRTTRRRGRVFAALFVVCAFGIFVRLVQLQLVQHGHWRAAASAMQERVLELPPRRGAILDRDGTVLAFDVKAKALAVDGVNATGHEALAVILSEELDVGWTEAIELVRRPSYFTWIDRRVDLETALRIERRAQEAGAYGLIFIDTWKRCYPEGRLASNVIGFVGIDGAGLEGIELAFDDVLRGTSSLVDIVEGADGRTYQVQVIAEGSAGRSITLTIDAALQFICEQEIERGVSTFRADRGMIVVLDPHSGEVLAMAQDNGYDLNRFWESDPEQRQNLAVTYLFEPGSSFKVLTGLAALEAGVVDVDDVFNGNDGIVISGHVMHNAENRSFGTVTFAEIIEDSINTGMIRVAQQLGVDALHGFLTALEFGRVTGIALPGEEGGILREAKRWAPLDLAAASIGQSIAVTGIQLARAMAVVANGGLLVAPRIVLAIDGEGRETDRHPPQVASGEGCATMRELMRKVVETGTGTPAAIEGFAVAGKTGTAQKAVPGRGYVSGKYTSLFAGLLPAEDPEYVTLVVLDEVKTTPVWGGYTSGQIFRDAMTRAVRVERLVPIAGQ